MINEESGLFQVRFTEEGKKFIRKFAAISYFILFLVFVENCVTIYWNLNSLTTSTYDAAVLNKTYFRVMPYILILSSLLSLAGNIYYVRFPRVLLKCIEANDKYGANRAFRTLFRGAAIFLIWLLIATGMIAWGVSVGVGF